MKTSGLYPINGRSELTLHDSCYTSPNFGSTKCMRVNSE
jgi:hypothetical protein